MNESQKKTKTKSDMQKHKALEFSNAEYKIIMLNVFKRGKWNKMEQETIKKHTGRFFKEPKRNSRNELHNNLILELSRIVKQHT